MVVFKCDPWTSSISITWRLVRHANTHVLSYPHPESDRDGAQKSEQSLQVILTFTWVWELPISPKGACVEGPQAQVQEVQIKGKAQLVERDVVVVLSRAHVLKAAPFQ